MKRVIWLALFVCMVLSLWGKIRLPSILGDNMVLQRSDTVNIWGWAAPSQNVGIAARRHVDGQPQEHGITGYIRQKQKIMENGCYKYRLLKQEDLIRLILVMESC